MKKHDTSALSQLVQQVQECESILSQKRFDFKRYLTLILNNPSILIPDIITDYFNTNVIKEYFLYLDFEMTYKTIEYLLPDIQVMQPQERHGLFKRIIAQQQENQNGTLLDDFTYLNENQVEEGGTPSLTPTSKTLITFLKAYGNIEIRTVSQYLEWFYPSIKKTIAIQVKESEDKFEFQLDEMDDTAILASIDLHHLKEFRPVSSDEIIHIQFLDLYKNTNKRTHYLIALHEFLSKNETLYQKLKNTNWFQPYHYAILKALYPNDFKKKLESIIIVLRYHRAQQGPKSLPFFGNEISNDIYYINELFSTLLSLPQDTIHLLESIPLCDDAYPNFNHFRNGYLINPNGFTLNHIISILEQFSSVIEARKELNLALPSTEGNNSNESSKSESLIPYETTEAPVQFVHLDEHKIHYFIDDILIANENIIPFTVTIAFLHKFGHFSVANDIVSFPIFFKETTLSIDLFKFLCDLNNEALIYSLTHHFDHLFVGRLPDIIENHLAIYDKLGKIPDYLATQLILSLPISRKEYQKAMQYKGLSYLGLYSRKITNPDKVNFISTELPTFIAHQYKLNNITDVAMSCYLLAHINIVELSNHPIRNLLKDFTDKEIYSLVILALKNEEITIKDILYLSTCLSSEVRMQLQPELTSKILTLKQKEAVDINNLIKFNKKRISANIAAELIKHVEIYQLSSIDRVLSVILFHLNKHPNFAAAYFSRIPFPYDELVLKEFLSEESEFTVETIFDFLKIQKNHLNSPDNKTNRFFKIIKEKMDDILLNQWGKFLGNLSEQNKDPHFSNLFTYLLKPYLDVCDRQFAHLVIVAIIRAQVPFESIIRHFAVLKNECAVAYIEISLRSQTQYNLPQCLLLLCSNNLTQNNVTQNLSKKFIQSLPILKPTHFFKSMRDLFINSSYIIDKLLSERFFLLKPLLVTVEYLDLLIESLPESIKSQYEKKCFLQCETDILVMRQLCSDLSNYHHYFDLHTSIFRDSPNTDHFLCQIKPYLTLPGFFDDFFETLEEADDGHFMNFLMTLFKDKLYDTLSNDRELLLFFKASPEREAFLSLIQPNFMKEIHALLDSITEEASTTQVLDQSVSSELASLSDNPHRQKNIRGEKRHVSVLFSHENLSEKRHEKEPPEENTGSSCNP